MPLEAGKSKGAFAHNVATEMKAGKPQKQAVAIAYSQSGEHKDSTHSSLADWKDIVRKKYPEAKIAVSDDEYHARVGTKIVGTFVDKKNISSRTGSGFVDAASDLKSELAQLQSDLRAARESSAKGTERELLQKISELDKKIRNDHAETVKRYGKYVLLEGAGVDGGDWFVRCGTKTERFTGKNAKRDAEDYFHSQADTARVDMSKSDWDDLRRTLDKFIGEERREPEHREDAVIRTDADDDWEVSDRIGDYQIYEGTRKNKGRWIAEKYMGEEKEFNSQAAAIAYARQNRSDTAGHRRLDSLQPDPWANTHALRVGKFVDSVEKLQTRHREDTLSRFCDAAEMLSHVVNRTHRTGGARMDARTPSQGEEIPYERVIQMSQNGEWEPMQDIVPGKLVEIRYRTGTRTLPGRVTIRVGQKK